MQSEGSQLKTNPFLSVRFAINLIAWPSLMFMENQAGGVRILYFFIRLCFLISLFNSLRQFKNIRMYDFSWRTYFGFKKNKFENKKLKFRQRKALVEQSFTQTPIDFKSNSLYKVSFMGRPYRRKFSPWMNALLQQHNSHFHLERDSWEQRWSTVFINCIFC